MITAQKDRVKNYRTKGHKMNMNNIFGNPIVVASMQGSLPMGGAKISSPIYALENTPSFLDFSQSSSIPTSKVDIDLNDILAFSIDNVITQDEADLLISLTESLGYRDDAPGIQTPPGMRQNKTVHWVANESLLSAIYTRIKDFLPEYIDGKRLSPVLSHRINFYKYQEGDVFNRHIDGGWPGYGLNEDQTSMVQWEGMQSELTMLLYLNGIEDGIKGGSTKLYSKTGEAIEIQPTKGKSLFFRHGHSTESVLHEGSRVTGNTPKYVARINILYEKT